MDSPEPTFNAADMKTRKRWLFSTIFMSILYPLVISVFISILIQWMILPKEAIIEPLQTAFQGIITTLIIWHCAYRKSGTKLLTLWLFVSPIRQIIELTGDIIQNPDQWTVVLGMIDVGVFSWWYLLSLKLRKVNLAAQSAIAKL